MGIIYQGVFDIKPSVRNLWFCRDARHYFFNVWAGRASGKGDLAACGLGD